MGKQKKLQKKPTQPQATAVAKPKQPIQAEQAIQQNPINPIAHLQRTIGNRAIG